MSHLKPGKPTPNGKQAFKSKEERCEHQLIDPVDMQKDGLMLGECESCGQEMIAKEIDNEWLKDSGKIVVTEWREW